MTKFIIAALIATTIPQMGAAAAPWPAMQGQRFTPEVEAWLAPFATDKPRTSIEDPTGKIDTQIAACMAGKAIAHCAEMILSAHQWLNDKALVDPAIAYVEQVYPVDLLVLSDDRGIDAAPDAARIGARLLRLVGEASDLRHGTSDPRSVRRQLAFKITAWRLGHYVDWSSFLSWPETPPADPTLAAQIANFRAVAGLNPDLPSRPDEQAAMRSAHAVLGDLIAPNLARYLATQGNDLEAARVAERGYEVWRGRVPAVDRRVRASMAALLDVSQQKSPQLLALARQLVEQTDGDGNASAYEKMTALRLLAKQVPAAEQPTLLRRALAIADTYEPSKFAAALAESMVTEYSVGGIGQGPAAKAAANLEKGRFSQLHAELATALGASLLQSNPAEAKSLFKKALALDGMNRDARVYYAMALMIRPEPDPGPGDRPDYQLASANLETLPETHLMRILGLMLSGAITSQFDAKGAYSKMRDAASGVRLRVGQYRAFDAAEQEEFSQLRGVFTAQVQSAWNAQER